MKRYCLYLFILIGISCSAELKAQKNGTIYKGNDPAVRYTGRTLVSPDGSVAFDWVGTYLETRFTGGKLSVKVSETGTSYYNVFVDGKLHKVVKVCGTDTLIHLVSGIDKRIHSLKIQKRSEGRIRARQLSISLSCPVRDAWRKSRQCEHGISSLSETHSPADMAQTGNIAMNLSW